MSVLLETSCGDITVDLFTDYAPKSCENFLKLCKIKYFNFAPIFSVQKGVLCQTGDPVGPGAPGSDGGSAIWGLLDGPSKKDYEADFNPKLKHTDKGIVSMATAKGLGDSRRIGSQFLVTLGEKQHHLDGKAVPFAKVVEGYDVLQKINDAFVDDNGRPLKDIRIRHSIVLDDPFPDPPGLIEPESSPVPSKAQLATIRIADNEEIDDNVDPETLEKLRREREARAQALTLEMIGDLPFEGVKPPENVLFVCKLNPVTQDEDLNLIFSRFGQILSCEVIRDKQTGESLQYAFVEFENQKDCERAYFSMQNILIDDHRIHVDFSQSVSKLSDSWRSATTAKRARQAGFGGISGLEKKRQYREADGDHRSGRYGMVFDRHEVRKERDRDSRFAPGDSHRKGRRSSSRSRSPYRRERSPHGAYRDRRGNSRDRDRDRDKYSRGSGGRRDRERERR